MLMEMFASENLEIAPPLSGTQLVEAIRHLHKSLELIDGARSKLQSGVFDGVFTSSELAEGWHEVNLCRVYTETTAAIEEYLQPALGLINDAKSMIDSLIAWGHGMTLHGKINILSCLEEAESGIRSVLEEMESWIHVDHKDYFCSNCGRRYVVGDNYCSACGRKLNAGI